MAAFQRFVDFVDAIARYLSVAIVITITGVMLTQVFFRKVLNDSLQWPEELSVAGLAWLVFVGAAILIRNWEHIGIPTFVDLLPGKARIAVMVLAKFLTIVFLAILLWYGIQVFNATFHGKAPSLPFSSRWAKLSIPVGGGLMLIIAINSILKDLLALWRGDLTPFKRPDIPGVE
jgi:TRAP-type C4-dicarboxylate transport system permease small subunit